MPIAPHPNNDFRPRTCHGRPPYSYPPPSRPSQANLVRLEGKGARRILGPTCAHNLRLASAFSRSPQEAVPQFRR
jgi:hypothetical protein